jgi:predicted phosphohydrolase
MGLAVIATVGPTAPVIASADPESADLAPRVLGAEVLAANGDTVGLVDPSQGKWHLRNALGGQTSFYYGNPGDVPIIGDWNCDGDETPGLYRQSDGFVYLRNSNTQGVADIRFFFGNPSDVPLAGDFDGDGCDSVSIYRPSEGRVFIINELGKNDGGLGEADLSYYFGNPGDKPFVGDFDGNGKETIGLHRESTGFVYFRLSHSQGVADTEFFFGDPGDRFVAGDWIADTISTPGLFRPSNTTFYVRHSNTQGVADAQVSWGESSWLPVAGTFGLPDDLPIPDPDPGPDPDPDPGPDPDPDPTAQPSPPIRAAFLYPWFPKAWSQSGISPFTQFTPSLGLYDSADPATINQQLRLAKTARLEAFISSWWGQGHHTDTALDAILAQVPSSPHPAMKLAIYYEEEGRSDPNPGTIVTDLDYLADRYFSDPSYLRVDGKPVIFVWAESDDRADMTQRWKQAKADFGEDLYVVLKVFTGFKSDPNQPDSWHQYGPAAAYHESLPYYATVSPGFWHALEGSPRLSRDTTRFRSDVEQMVASDAFWQLVTTWNEWGEGTSVEPADEFGETYIDILADEIPAPPTTTTTPPPSGSVTVTAAGDMGASSDATATLGVVAAVKPDAHFVVGDLSYSDLTPESAWCSYVRGIVGASQPVELLTGNHEDDNGSDGFIRNFTACLPDKLSVSGDYGVQYYEDFGAIARVVAISPDARVDGVSYDYQPGSSERQWLESVVASAKAQGKWVVLLHHKPCISSAEKTCDIGEELADWEAANVDVIVMGHAHNYQRTHQLSCVDVNKVTPSCIADNDGNHRQGNGAVFVINGLGGRERPVNRSDPEFGYFAALLGEGDPGEGHGVVQLDITSSSLTGTFVGGDTSWTDTFTIRR